MHCMFRKGFDYMDIRHLRYFVAVVEEQSFTKASERLFIAQPPLSRQINNLEDELGTPLLNRNSRPIEPTDAGKFFYQYAKRILNNIDQMVAMTRRTGTSDRKLRVGFTGSLLLGLLPQIIYQFRQLAPHLQIEFIEINTFEQVEALKKGDIDVGFGRLSFSDPIVKRILLRNEPLVLAVHKSHPLAQNESGVYLADIVDELVLLFPDTAGYTFATHIKSIFYEHGLTIDHTESVSGIRLALGIAASGSGVCVVPQNSRAIHMTDLKYIPILDPGAVSPIHISFRSMEDNEYIHLMLTTIDLIYKKLAFQDELSITPLFNEMWNYDDESKKWKPKPRSLNLKLDKT